MIAEKKIDGFGVKHKFHSKISEERCNVKKEKKKFFLYIFYEN